jgi:hypothetical protein
MTEFRQEEHERHEKGQGSFFDRMNKINTLFDQDLPEGK